MSAQSAPPPRLVLLEGDGEGRSPARAKLSLGHPPTESVQLTLPIAQPGTTVLYSISLRPWADESFVESTLRAAHITSIFDIRLSASFGGAVIERSRWLELLARLNITYVHLPELANSYGGNGDRQVDHAYRRYLSTQEVALRRIVDALRSGSVAVMVFGSAQEEGDREAVIDILLTLSAHRNLAVLRL